MLSRRLSEDLIDVMCSRCLCSDIAATENELVDRGWELRPDGQTWCLRCSSEALAPRGRPNARGVVKARRRPPNSVRSDDRCHPCG